MAGPSPTDEPVTGRHQPLINALELVAEQADQARDSIEDVEYVHETLTDPTTTDNQRAFAAMARLRAQLEDVCSAMTALATVVTAYGPVLEDLEMRLEAALAHGR